MSRVSRVSSLRRAVNAVVGVALALILALVCLQIYRVATGQAPIYGREGAVTDQISTITTTVTTPPSYADSDLVQSIVHTEPVEPEDLGGDASTVVFRSPSGQIVCAISTDLAAADTGGWLPLPADSSGEPAAGAGALCAGIANLDVRPEDAHACGQGESLRSSVLGVWGEKTGIGVCSSDATRMFADARDHAAGGGDRYSLAQLDYATHVRLGDYACLFDGAAARCANVKTGRGFVYEESVSYGFR